MISICDLRVLMISAAVITMQKLVRWIANPYRQDKAEDKMIIERDMSV